MAVLVRSPQVDEYDLYILDGNSNIWTHTHRIDAFSDGGVMIPQCLGSGHIVILRVVEFSDISLFFCGPPHTGCVPGNNEIMALDPSWHTAYAHVQSLVRLNGMFNIREEPTDQKTNPLYNNWYMLL